MTSWPSLGGLGVNGVNNMRSLRWRQTHGLFWRGLRRRSFSSPQWRTQGKPLGAPMLYNLSEPPRMAVTTPGLAVKFLSWLGGIVRCFEWKPNVTHGFISMNKFVKFDVVCWWLSYRLLCPARISWWAPCTRPRSPLSARTAPRAEVSPHHSHLGATRPLSSVPLAVLLMQWLGWDYRELMPA